MLERTRWPVSVQHMHSLRGSTWTLQRPRGVLPDAVGGARATGDTAGEEWGDAKPHGQDTAGRQPAAPGIGAPRGLGQKGAEPGGPGESWLVP